HGQLGDGTTNSSYVPEKIFALNPINASVRLTAIAAGGAHSLFGSYNFSSGSLYAMGGNSYGQLGDGTTTDHYQPEAVVSASPGSPVAASACGWNHSLFIRPDGTVAAMGDNEYGQLGDNTVVD